jgi:FKBP-type peptidyl-prolyl cis-trans isomerase
MSDLEAWIGVKEDLRAAKMAQDRPVYITLMNFLDTDYKDLNTSFSQGAESSSDFGSAGGGAINESPAAAIAPTPTMQNVTELQVSDVKVGSGAEVKQGSKASVLYKGMLTDGTVFDASSLHGNTPFEFVVGAGMVIKGWDQGLVGMKVGGQRRLVIPSTLGYGEQGMGPIPGGATLVFEVELLDVK